MTTVHDAFDDLARYYDRLMQHVDYNRWLCATTAVSRMFRWPFRHLDAACGTGTLLRRLRKAGWGSVGVDLSPAMIRQSRKTAPLPVAVADLRALPFHGAFDFVTCLFDSMNFILDYEGVEQAFQSVYRALDTTGIFYFDIVTERMVKDFFAGQEWTEDNGGFSTTWKSEFHQPTAISRTSIRVGSGMTSVVTERVYEIEEIEAAFRNAGFESLGVFDAQTWKKPRKRSVRLDFVLAKGNDARVRDMFSKVQHFMQQALSG